MNAWLKMRVLSFMGMVCIAQINSNGITMAHAVSTLLTIISIVEDEMHVLFECPAY